MLLTQMTINLNGWSVAFVVGQFRISDNIHNY